MAPPAGRSVQCKTPGNQDSGDSPWPHSVGAVHTEMFSLPVFKAAIQNPFWQCRVRFIILTLNRDPN